MAGGDCGSRCPVEGGFYAYDPNIGGNAALLAAFAVLVPVVLFLGVRFRTPVFSAILATGLLLSVVGFVGRILLNGSPRSQGLFVLSLLGTVLGPVCVSGAIFLTLPHILSIYGDHLSPFRPMVAGLVFYILDAVAAIIQVVGIVFVAYDLGGMSRMGGTRLIAGGLGVQLIALLGFSGLHFWFTLGVSTRRSTLDPKHAAIYRSRQFKRFLLATELASVLLVAYSAYRIVEMAGNVDGNLFQSQAAFMIMNGATPLVSAVLITILQPGAAFGSAWGPTSPLRVRKRRGAPAPLNTQHLQPDYVTHHRYDPEIRKQISPASQGHLRKSSKPPELPSGSPGLPANPKPVHKNGSPMSSPMNNNGGSMSSPGNKNESPTRSPARNNGSPMPLPTNKNGSPMPSPTETVGTAATVETRSSIRNSTRLERRSIPPTKMVEKDSLW